MGRRVVAVTAVAAVLLVGGHILGRAAARPRPPATRGHIAAHPVDARAHAAAAQAPAGPARFTGPGLAALNPITGPGRPPLPAERGGPYGSRRTTGTPEVALTFDDGPDPTWTPQVLDLLHRHHLKATFCMIGAMADAYPQIVRQVVAAGHTLCNHSYYHNINLGQLSPDAIRADMTRTSAAIHRAAPGVKISYYRQPGGVWTPTIVAIAKDLGMTALHWRIDPQDWRKPGAGYIYDYIASKVSDGAIVLMHDGGGDRHGTVDALRALLPNLTRRFWLVALPPGRDAPPQFGLQWPVHPGQV